MLEAKISAQYPKYVEDGKEVIIKHVRNNFVKFNSH